MAERELSFPSKMLGRIKEGLLAEAIQVVDERDFGNGRHSIFVNKIPKKLLRELRASGMELRDDLGDIIIEQGRFSYGGSTKEIDNGKSFVDGLAKKWKEQSNG